MHFTVPHLQRVDLFFSTENWPLQMIVACPSHSLDSFILCGRLWIQYRGFFWEDSLGRLCGLKGFTFGKTCLDFCGRYKVQAVFRQLTQEVKRCQRFDVDPLQSQRADRGNTRRPNSQRLWLCRAQCEGDAWVLKTIEFHKSRASF